MGGGLLAGLAPRATLMRRESGTSGLNELVRTFRRDGAGRHVTVAIVNQEYARQFGFGADVVGRQTDDGPGKTIEIIGMCGNVRTRGLRAAPWPEVYLSSLQLSWANTYLMVRSPLPPGQLLKQVKTAIGSANSEQPVFGVQTMEEVIFTTETRRHGEKREKPKVLMTTSRVRTSVSGNVRFRTNEIRRRR